MGSKYTLKNQTLAVENSRNSGKQAKVSSYLHFSFNQFSTFYTNNIPSFPSREFCNFWHIIFLKEFRFWKESNVFIPHMRKQRLKDGRGGVLTLLLCCSTPGGALHPTAHLNGACGSAEPQPHCSYAL